MVRLHPIGPEIERVKVSLGSSTLSSVVCTVNVCDPAAVCLKVSVLGRGRVV